jgi:hypothetical protein
MKIISFTGPRGSGKDTAADLLREAGISLGKISFAGPMKEILARVFNFSPHTFEDRKLKEKPFEEPLILNLEMIQVITLECLKILPPTEFDYSGFFKVQSTEQTKIHTPRYLLQYVGTQMIRRLIHPDWHVAAAFRTDFIDQLPEGTYCVTDARFPNEYKWLKERFGSDFTGFYVERPEAEEELTFATHESELQVKEVRKLIPETNVLKNDGTVSDLKIQLIKKINKGNTDEQT